MSKQRLKILFLFFFFAFLCVSLSIPTGQSLAKVTATGQKSAWRCPVWVCPVTVT